MEPSLTDQEHRSYRELLGAYSLAAVSTAEHAAVESHLRECASCRAEVAQLRAVVAALPLSVEDREPPAALRTAILTAVSAQPSRAAPQPSIGTPPVAPAPSLSPVTDLAAEREKRNWLPWAAAAAMLLLSIGLAVWNFNLRGDSVPAPMTVAFEPMADDVSAGAAAAYMEDAGVIKVWLTNDPGLADDEVLQLWMIEPDGTAVPAGIMTEPRSPIAVAASPEDFDMLAITREPGPMGMPEPTTPPILTAHFGDTATAGLPLLHS